MTVTINIPDAVAPTIVDGICAATSYDAGSGKTKAVWAKEQIIKTMKAMAGSGIVKTAVADAKATIEAAVVT